MTILAWDPATTPAALHAPLTELAAEYPVRAGTGDLAIAFVHAPGDACTVSRSGAAATVRYGRTNLALRAVAALLAGVVPDGGSATETAAIARVGIMLDCSRNAVMRPEHVERWLRRMALMGGNLLMLYTEDTYEIPGEPRFGYQRGRYTQAELRRIDATARRLGIEMVGCIQTLAHLEQITRWPEYGAVCDFRDTLLEGEPRTYELIGRMLDAISGSITSRRIHIGMDEAWSLGRGKHLDRHGGTAKFEILTRHLARVEAMCRERGLEPMVWSDMWFRLGSATHDYYDPAAVIPADVAARIPRDLTLVYWDYYHADPAFYRGMIARHRALGRPVSLASGIHTWGRLWYEHAETVAKAGPCIDAARAEGLDELLFTMWGDDGAACDLDAGLAGLAWCLERCFAPAAGEARLPALFRALCQADWSAVAGAGELGHWRWTSVLWDDPILGICATSGFADGPGWDGIGARLAAVRDRLAALPVETGGGDLGHARRLADVMAQKVALRSQLAAAYAGRDRAGLLAVRDAALALAPVIEDLAASWRRGWMRRNKPQGFEVIQLRMAQQAERHRELARRLDELLSGEVATIPELDESCAGTGGGWHHLASGSVCV